MASGCFLVGLAQFLWSHYLPELGVLILISRVTGAQSRNVFCLLKYEVQVCDGKFLNIQTAAQCVTDENAQATKSGRSGGEKMKNKNPLKPLTETSEENQTNSETGHMQQIRFGTHCSILAYRMGGLCR